MKRFWWDFNRDKFCWDEGPNTVMRSDESGLFVSNELPETPREIQSAEYNPETGRIKLVPKEPVSEPTFVEEMAAFFRINLPDTWNGSGYNKAAADAIALVKRELDREKQQPSNPYTKEAVDELLDAMKIACGDFFSEKCDFQWDVNVRTWNAVQSLLRQSDSGKAVA